MKKYIIIGLIVVLGAAFLVGPLLKGGSTPEDTEEIAPALFTFKDNLATRWNEVIPLTIEVNSQEIDKLELKLKDDNNSLQQLKELKERLERTKLAEFEEDLREDSNKQILLKG